MRILFIGCAKISEAILCQFIVRKENVVGVITKDKSNNVDFRNLGNLAKEWRIPFKYCLDREWIEDLRPDIIFCIGYSDIVPREILDIPPMGCIGYHPTLLPKNRGRHPIVWALVGKWDKTGSTFFFMDEGVDSGDIISQREIKISKGETSKTLYHKIILTAGMQMIDFMGKLKNGEVIRIPQDHSQATYLRARTEEEKKGFRYEV